MPDLVERLANVQEHGWSILSVVQCFVYYIGKAMAFLYSRMRFSESELMPWYPRLEVCSIVYPFE
jgi:hypothetical protein